MYITHPLSPEEPECRHRQETTWSASYPSLMRRLSGWATSSL